MLRRKAQQRLLESAELFKLPLARPRVPIEFWETRCQVFEEQLLNKFPEFEALPSNYVYDTTRASLKFLFDPIDILDAMQSISLSSGKSDDDDDRDWSMLAIPIQATSMEDMAYELREMHPKCLNYGSDELRLTMNASDDSRLEFGDEVVRLGRCDLARQYLKQGCTQSLRPCIWKLCLISTNYDDTTSFVKSC